MSNIELVIKIPEKYIKTVQHRNPLSLSAISEVEKAIAVGIPIPKGCDIQRVIPKRVDIQKWIPTECPNCNRELSTHHGDGYYSIEHKPDFCPNCGQALLWESEE